MKRTDYHRPGAIIPNDYTYLLSYVTPGGHAWDAYNMDRARLVCEQHAWGRDGTMWGNLGKCGICGARYRNGDIWTHDPTGDIIHVGHDCARKYEMLSDRPGFDVALDQLKRRRATFINDEKNRILREGFLAGQPGLEEALQGDHHILRNLSESLKRWNSLTPRQVAFAMKLAREVKERASKPEPPAEKHVPAPVGRHVVRGRIISRKQSMTEYGETTKVTVRVETPEGSWFAWGSAFVCVANVDDLHQTNVGDLVEFKGTLSGGRDPHFAFFKRPSNGRLIEAAKGETT